MSIVNLSVSEREKQEQELHDQLIKNSKIKILVEMKIFTDSEREKIMIDISSKGKITEVHEAQLLIIENMFVKILALAKENQ